MFLLSMKNLLLLIAKKELLERIDKLESNTQRQWGKMDVAQMMAHCSAAFEVASGERTRKRGLLGYLFGGVYKKKYVYDNSFKKNDPTDPTFKITDQRDFQTEKMRLITHLEKFQSNGPQGVTKADHPFFGPMTPTEWGQLMYNHLNHHLQQFGV